MKGSAGPGRAWLANVEPFYFNRHETSLRMARPSSEAQRSERGTFPDLHVAVIKHGVHRVHGVESNRCACYLLQIKRVHGMQHTSVILVTFCTNFVIPPIQNKYKCYKFSTKYPKLVSGI